jgi:sucrose phosphorylase
MIKETFDFIAAFEEKASQKGIDVLVEIHSFFQTQIEIAKKVGYVYDFALPVLVLDLLYNQTAERLKHWIEIRPTNTVTVLDTHDGIGIIDVASENGKPGLIPDAILEEIVETMHAKNKDQSRKSTGAAASNLDLYQVNCTYFEALGQNETHYLLARAIQFFLPGVPQVYYVGLFGDLNDMELLAKTGVGRDINRHYYSREEIQSKLEQKFIVQLQELMRLRNTHPAFQGVFTLLDSSKASLHCRWEWQDQWTELQIDPISARGVIRFSAESGPEEMRIQ